MRKNTFKMQLRELKNRLKSIAGRELGLIEKFNETMAAIGEFLNQVNAQVRLDPFKDQLEEIYYFKFEKPEFFALKIYHTMLFKLQSSLPIAVPELLREYYMQKLGDIARYFRDYRFLYDYYRFGHTDLDEMLFVRGAEVKFPLLQDLPELDRECATCGDYVFAMFMAYEDLQVYLLGELKKLDQQSAVEVLTGPGKKWFDWTGETVNLVELGYAIWLSGQLNEGNAGIKEVFGWLEASFGVDFGIPANRFREIRRRKRLSYTRFLDNLKSGLVNYIHEAVALDSEESKSGHRSN